MPATSRGFLISAVVGAGVGIALGALSASIGSSFDGGLPRNLGVVVLTGLSIGGLGLLGLMLLVPRATRGFGQGLVLAALCAAAGFFVASRALPQNPGQQALAGTVHVELSSPSVQVLEAAAVCNDPGRPDRALEIEAPLGRVGIDDLRAFVSVFRGGNTATLSISVNTMPGYQGAAAVADMRSDRRAGRLTFTGLESTGAWIGGSENVLTGTLTWVCPGTGGSPHTPAPPSEFPQTVDGWFKISGLILVDRDLPGATPPFPGRATGRCTSTARYGVEALETVVDWSPHGRARLRLVPGPTSAELRIDRGDGTEPEVVVAPATVTERKSGSIVLDRTLRGEFDARDGHLAIEVNWFCPN